MNHDQPTAQNLPGWGFVLFVFAVTAAVFAKISQWERQEDRRIWEQRVAREEESVDFLFSRMKVKDHAFVNLTYTSRYRNLEDCLDKMQDRYPDLTARVERQIHRLRIEEGKSVLPLY